MAVAVVKDGKLVYSKADSYDHTIKVESRFRIGSVTKQFTAGLIVKLAESKKLSLDDSLGKWIEDAPSAWKPATIRQLLSHTSGIPSYTANPGFEKVSNTKASPDRIWKFVKGDKMDFAPGKGWNYSNTGYCLLGSIAEKATNKPYFALLKEYFFSPLKMNSTGEERSLPVVKSYGANGKSSVPLNMDWPYSAGAIVSTVGDLAKWDAALRADKLFSKEEKNMMFSPDPVAAAYKTPYGFGWIPMVRDGKVVGVTHSGGINGFGSNIVRSLEGGTTVIALSNSETEFVQYVSRQIFTSLEPELLKSKMASIVDPDPAISVRHRALFENLLKGQVDASLFAKSFLAQVPEDKLKSGGTGLAAVGKLGRFELVRVVPGPTVSREYRVQLGSQLFQLAIGEDAEHKVTTLLIRQ